MTKHPLLICNLEGVSHFGWPLAKTMARAQGFASELVRRGGATMADPALYRSLREAWGIASAGVDSYKELFTSKSSKKYGEIHRVPAARS